MNTDKMPTVSVVIPTHNRPDLLAEAIDSVRRQTFADYEIIVVSNGETPENQIRTGTVAATRGCVYQLVSEGNRSLARNIGASCAQGEWIALLDDDDLWTDRNKLLGQLAFAVKMGADVVFTDFILRAASGNEATVELAPRRPVGRTIAEAMVSRQIAAGGASTVLVTRRAYMAVGGFDVKMPQAEDWDMWRRLSQKFTVVFLDTPMTTCRTHGLNGENMVFRRPLYCLYWNWYHQIKAIRTAPPELRHMTGPALGYLAKQSAYFLLALLAKDVGDHGHLVHWRPLARIGRVLRPRTRLRQLLQSLRERHG